MFPYQKGNLTPRQNMMPNQNMQTHLRQNAAFPQAKGALPVVQEQVQPNRYTPPVQAQPQQPPNQQQPQYGMPVEAPQGQMPQQDQTGASNPHQFFIQEALKQGYSQDMIMGFLRNKLNLK